MKTKTIVVIFLLAYLVIFHSQACSASEVNCHISMVTFDHEGIMVYVSGWISCYEICKNVLVTLFIESEQGGHKVIYFTVKDNAQIFKSGAAAYDHASDGWKVSTAEFVCIDKKGKK